MLRPGDAGLYPRQLAGAQQLQVECRGEAERVRSALLSVPNLKDVRLESSNGTTVFRVEMEPGQDARGAVARAVVQSGADLLELKSSGPSLEDIFLKLTTDESEASAEDEAEA